MSARAIRRFLGRALAPLLAGVLACAGGGLAVGSLPGCSTPSVPLPPPEVDLRFLAFSSPAAGQVVLSGMPRETHASATIFFVHERSGNGIITQAASDGSFTTMPLSAQEGDAARIQLETPDGTLSDPTCVTILIGKPLVAAACQ